MHRNQSASVHQFAMVPNRHIPRSSFLSQKTHKTSFDAGLLIPLYVKEIVPGDTIKLRHTIFCRMATPLFPVMDNLYLDTFYFFVPNRLVWNNWVKMMGEQDNPGDSISYTTPQQVSPAGGYAVGSLQDYMGLPAAGGPLAGNTKSHNALPLRMYNLIWNQWFRDQNLQSSAVVDKGDGPDASPSTNYALKRRGKRHDYFTSALPWPQKGSAGVAIPLSGNAPVTGIGFNNNTIGGARTTYETGSALNVTTAYAVGKSTNDATNTGVLNVKQNASTQAPEIFANLASASAAVLVSQLRQSIMIQELLEIDARGGTRYTEIVRSHFGVNSPDARLQRPEYIGGGSTPVNINPIAQTAQTGITGGTTPMGTLAGMATVVDHAHGFTYSAVEHGFIIGLASVRADLTYQQGIHRMWTRATRYDYYFPALANLGEFGLRNDEIYCQGTAADTQVFGYQEAWAEYRYDPNMVTSLMRSTATGTIDAWHLAQKFAALPTLSDTFIQDNPPVSRVVAVGAGANGQQFLCDAFFDVTMARPMPLYGVPGISSYL